MLVLQQNSILTNDGNNLLALAVAGTPLQFSSIKTSDYIYPPDTDFTQLTELQGIQQTITDFSVTVYNDTQLRVSANITNIGLINMYQISQIGLYAMTDDGEVLVSISQSINSEWMPQEVTGVPNAAINVQLYITVSSTALINLVLPTTGYALIVDLDLKEDIANKGIANGYADLDENAKIPLSRLPDAIVGSMTHAGDVDASTVIANLTSAGQAILGITDAQITLTNDTTATTGYTDNQGNYYLVTVAGTFAGISYNIGDWIIANSTGWGIVNNTDEVTGVKGNAETNYRIGNINISLENLGYSAQATEPTASSTDSQLVTAKRFWSMMGSALSSLKTTAKTLVGTINELWSNTYSLSGGTAIPANADLNSYQTVGNYYCVGNDIAATLKNCPTTRAFTLKIDLPTGGTNYRSQTVRDSLTGRTVYRLYDATSGWGRWTTNMQDIDFAYQDITSLITNTDPSKVSVTAAYIENGQVVISISIAAGTSGTLKPLTISNDRYRPRTVMNGTIDYQSHQDDFGKIMSARVYADGTIGYWVLSALTYPESVTFVYPIRTS